MSPAEIAETLLNGNIAQARNEIFNRHDLAFHHTSPYAAAACALDVVAELASILWMTPSSEEPVDVLREAHQRVRRCLEGAPNG